MGTGGATPETGFGRRNCFRTHDYLGHFVIMRRDLARSEFRSELRGAGLRFAPAHFRKKRTGSDTFSRVLYHWRRTAESTAHNIRRKPGALEAGRRAIEQHLVRRQENARVTIDWETHLYAFGGRFVLEKNLYHYQRGCGSRLPSGFGRKQIFRILKSSSDSRSG